MVSASNSPPRIKPLSGESFIAQPLGIPSDSTTPGYALIADAKAFWPEWERDLPLLVMEPKGAYWRGVVSARDEVEKKMTYHSDIGLCIIAK